ncbi:MAG: YIP1 family protein [Bacteroidota bacterium]|nr:YIP1 family protein [Bacteroidota bacterium]
MTFKNELLNLFNVIPTPTVVFEDLNKAPRWRLPLLFTLLSYIIIGWFMVPVIMEPMQRIYTNSFGEAGANAAISYVMKFTLLFQLLITPLSKIIKWLIIAICMYFFAQMLKKNKPGFFFNRYFAIVAYGETIFILMSLFTLLIIYAKGLSAIESSSDYQIFKGLNVLLSNNNSNLTLASVLGDINPFSIWYILTISIGIKVVTGLGRFKAIGVASLAWLVWMSTGFVQSVFTKLIFEMIT